ncbi:MAG: 16S rRNA (guanine(527)-N(7))-methyltransferase RsmG [Sphingomonadaceae bacterium]
MIEDEEQARDYVEKRCDKQAIARLDRLAAALIEENERQNLVSKASLNHIWQRHFADSAQLLDFVPHDEPSWIDLGSGAGFPGVVIACMRPDFRVTLVESRRKRITWLENMLQALGLEKSRVAGSTLQSVSSFPADVISARAFAPLPKLIDFSARFSTSDTIWVLPKGRSAAQEWQELPRRMRRMFHVEHSQTDAGAGIIVGNGRAEIGS